MEFSLTRDDGTAAIRLRRSALHARRRVRPRTQPMLLRATATEGLRYLHARRTMPLVEHPRRDGYSVGSIIRRLRAAGRSPTRHARARSAMDHPRVFAAR